MYGIWVAPPAMAMLAYASLAGVAFFDPVQRLLFCEHITPKHSCRIRFYLPPEKVGSAFKHRCNDIGL